MPIMPSNPIRRRSRLKRPKIGKAKKQARDALQPKGITGMLGIKHKGVSGLIKHARNRRKNRRRN